jgi:hypothetical protein
VAARALSFAVLALAVALFVDLFLHWSRGAEGFSRFAVTGWDLSGWIPVLTIALGLWELVRALGHRPGGRSAELVSFFLIGGVAVFVVATLVNLRWRGSYRVPWHGFGYGAWIALGLAPLLAAGGVVRLLEYRRLSR